MVKLVTFDGTLYDTFDAHEHVPDGIMTVAVVWFTEASAL